MEIAAASFPGIDLMGMCSRQERIQKDIDVVIQKSRAEKDCSFAGEFSFPSLRPSSGFPCPPAAPLPSFQSATCVAGGGRWVARPHAGVHLATAAAARAGTKRGRGRQPLPFSPPPYSGAGTSLWGRTRVAGAGL